MRETTHGGVRIAVALRSGGSPPPHDTARLMADKQRRSKLRDREKHHDREHSQGQDTARCHNPTSFRIYRSAGRTKANATPDSATGNNQAQSPSTETAEALTTHPKRKPNRRCKDLFKRSASSGRRARCFDSKSISDKTVLHKLPVMTAVEIAPGIAKRSSAYWQAIAETAIIMAIPAANPCGSADGLVMGLKIRTAASSRN